LHHAWAKKVENTTSNSSLEMEPSPQLVLQKELPIPQAISRVRH